MKNGDPLRADGTTQGLLLHPLSQPVAEADRERNRQRAQLVYFSGLTLLA